MFPLGSKTAASPNAGVGRRDFLQAGAMSALGLGLSEFSSHEAQAAAEKSCIFLTLVGGPSQLDTWDMKPNAPSEIRGPYQPIKTNVSGIEISEIFPRMARHADKYALIRSVYHTADAVHDTGHQLIQTGRLCVDGLEQPHIGCVLSQLSNKRPNVPPHVLLPRQVSHLGNGLPTGQTAGFLGKQFDPFVLDALSNELQPAPSLMPSAKLREALDLSQESTRTKDRYGHNRFGLNCLLARRMIEHGVRFVTVNMFDTVFNEITWDIHGSAPFSPMKCYSDFIGPMFDMAYSSLLEDLSQRGLLKTTMVVASGEFGRTPRINPAGGRDHWPHCWTMLMAGGGIQGGQVIGASDEMGAYPKDRPVTPAEVAATIYRGLGIDLKHHVTDECGQRFRIVEAGVNPISELF